MGVRLWSGLGRSDRVRLFAAAWMAMGIAAIGAVWSISSARAETPAAPAETLRVPRASPGPERPKPDQTGNEAVEEPGLDALLELPQGFGTVESEPAVAGSGEAEWRRRFRAGRDRLKEARTKLAATKRELDALAVEDGGQWNVGPAIGAALGGEGAQGRDTPLSFKLRQQLKQDREAVEQAEKELRRLQIEADLAGVPRSWRGREQPSVSSEPREISLP